MWNKLAPLVAGRGGGSAPLPEGPPSAPPPGGPAMAAPAPPPQPAAAPGPAAAPASDAASPPATPAAGGNVIGETLRDRASALTPQDSKTFFDGITVPALIVLKKLIPEIGPAIDGAIQRKQTGQGHAPLPTQGQQQAPQPPQPPAPGLRAL